MQDLVAFIQNAQILVPPELDNTNVLAQMKACWPYKGYLLKFYAF